VCAGFAMGRYLNTHDFCDRPNGRLGPHSPQSVAFALAVGFALGVLPAYAAQQNEQNETPSKVKPATQKTDSKLTVPHVLNESCANAVAALKALNLRGLCSSSNPGWIVTATEPQVGTPAKPNEPIQLIMGPATTQAEPPRVPPLIGLNYQQASDTLAKVGLQLGSVGQLEAPAASAATIPGTVVSQSPGINSPAKLHSSVDVNFSPDQLTETCSAQNLNPGQSLTCFVQANPPPLHATYQFFWSGACPISRPTPSNSGSCTYNTAGNYEVWAVEENTDNRTESVTSHEPITVQAAPLQGSSGQASQGSDVTSSSPLPPAPPPSPPSQTIVSTLAPWAAGLAAAVALLSGGAWYWSRQKQAKIRRIHDEIDVSSIPAYTEQTPVPLSSTELRDSVVVITVWRPGAWRIEEINKEDSK
jgi:beta-lactam-binding protein with PASTA domain